MRKTLFVLALLSVAAAQNAPRPAPFAKVRVTPQGRILLNDKPSSLDQLDLNFAALEKDHGIVWFFCEDATSPSPLAQKVKRKINDFHLAVRNCKNYDDPDCKEAVP